MMRIQFQYQKTTLTSKVITFSKDIGRRPSFTCCSTRMTAVEWKSTSFIWIHKLTIESRAVGSRGRWGRTASCKRTLTQGSVTISQRATDNPTNSFQRGLTTVQREELLKDKLLRTRSTKPLSHLSLANISTRTHYAPLPRTLKIRRWHWKELEKSGERLTSPTFSNPLKLRNTSLLCSVECIRSRTAQRNQIVNSQCVT